MFAPSPVADAVARHLSSTRRSGTRAGLIAGVVGLAGLVASCSSSAGVTAADSERLGDPSPPSSGVADGSTIDWASCGDGLDCGRLAVPLDYADPDGPTITLNLVRHRATQPADRIGSLLVNPGGPGSDGAWLAENAPLIYGTRLVERFDIIGWDPRGTGASDPTVDCTDRYDPYFAIDPTPDTPEEEQIAEESVVAFGEACLRRMGADVLAHISTRESATDMDTIRQALGEEQISFFGFSYGSELGATWATMFPDTVRAAVLDGAIDPTVPDYENDLKQAAGFEASLDSFLAECASDRDCAFYNDGDPGAALDRLLLQLDESPLEVSDDRAPVNQGVALIAIGNAMYGEPLWPALADALAAAQRGDGEGLLDGYDEYFQRQSDGTYSNLLEAFVAITCVDSDPAETRPDEDELTKLFQEAAPRLWPTFAGEGFCETWPVPPAGTVQITGAGAGPIVVVGTTGDAATPLESTRAMADALEDATLVTVEADQHTGYGLNECVNDAVDDYLADLTVPDPGLVCA
ncbi:MAG: alpha/beta hydrolase [Acidimicrobiia bacterium]